MTCCERADAYAGRGNADFVEAIGLDP